MKDLHERRELVERGHPELSLVQQCLLLGLHRSGIYYQPQKESELNEELMRKMDAHYLEHPYMGAPRMHAWLTCDLGYKVSRNRVDRLYYEVMGLRAILPGPHTSKRAKAHPVYPYLLRGLDIKRPNQVWATDITYIPMAKGFMYLVAVIDLHSRMVLSWSLSNTMEAEWCVEVVREAIERYGKPDIFNTDQGAQFTSAVFSGFITGQGIRLSMDGKGRATDNAFIERFWRSLKYEHVYLYPRQDVVELHQGIRQYIEWYNCGRRHSSLYGRRPKEVYGHLPSIAA
ncbi:MAG TPA: IS3 family transposase [Saprospiraceae bacterium]|nr:IS3 family transposase [Saprospiraceae bacterium]